MRNMGGLKRSTCRSPSGSADRHARHRRLPAVRRLLLQGRDPRRGVRPRRRSSRSTTCSTRWASLAAFCTAYYMSRLVSMTFFGEIRTGDARAGASPARIAVDHDRPADGAGRAERSSAACSTCRFVGGGAALEHWLEPIDPGRRGAHLEMPHESHRVPADRRRRGDRRPRPRGSASAPARGGRSPPAQRGAAETGLRPGDEQKWYVDELYDAIIVRPLEGSRASLWKGVDRRSSTASAVIGSATSSRRLGGLLPASSRPATWAIYAVFPRAARLGPGAVLR